MRRWGLPKARAPEAQTGDGQSRSILSNRRIAIIILGLIVAAGILAIAWFFL
jgi:hypothetical protein